MCDNIYYHGLFYGGYIKGGVELTNNATIFNIVGKIKEERNIGTARKYLSGANICGNGLFYGGMGNKVFGYSSVLSIINNNAELLNEEKNVGTARYKLAGGAINDVGLFYGGITNYYSNVTTIINNKGTLLLEKSTGSERGEHASASFDAHVLYYAGIEKINISKKIEINKDEIEDWMDEEYIEEEYGVKDEIKTNSVIMLDKNANIIADKVNVGEPRAGFAGTTVNNKGIFYGEYFEGNNGVVLDNKGNLLLSKYNIGTGRFDLASATVSGAAMFYGGNNSLKTSSIKNMSNTMSVFNSYLELLRKEICVGEGGTGLAGASI